MKKLFMNNKLMTAVMSVCLVVIIGGVAVFAAVSGGMLKGGLPVFGSQSSSSDSEAESLPEESTAVIVEPVVDGAGNSQQSGPIVYEAPERMMAVTLSAGTDYLTKDGMSTAEIQKEIDEAIDGAVAYSANTIYLKTGYKNKVLYSAEGMPQAEISFDVLKYITEKARSKNLFVYVIFDVLEASESGSTAISYKFDSAQYNQIKKNAAALCAYDIDGIMLDSYTVVSDSGAYENYEAFGNGMGYENYLRASTEAAVEAAHSAVKKADPTVAVGLAVDAVWANKESLDEGSETSADYESFADGFADTKKYIDNGKADFVAVKCNYATKNKNAKFADYFSWWNGTVGSETPLYIFQYATKACTEETGWGDPAELSDQIIAAEKLDKFSGSIFDSYAALKANPQQSTDALIQYLTENIDPSFLLTQLEMTRPSKKTFSTYENVVTFSGASDVNFELTMNGENVKRDANGAFMLTIDLSPGTNTFTFSHKEKTMVYTITRNVKVLKEISPLGNVTVGGGMSLTVSATAYKGSVVTATLAGSTVTLQPSTEADDSTDNESTYVIYTGTLTAPASTSSAQSLGNITITGKWENAATETLTGAYVKVSEKAQSGSLVEVVADSAETFPSSTLDDLSDYDCYPLAKGTRDYILGNEIVYKDGDNTYTYYNLESGQRVYTADVKTVSGDVGGNSITKMTINANSRYTYVIFEMEQQVSYIAKYTSSAFTIDFCYTTNVPASLNLSCTPLFSSANWSGTKLSLKLSTSGGFLGYYAYYDNGNLVFRFNNPTGSYSLSGVPIVVDVGHSALGVGALGYLSAYGEYEINLAVGKALKSELESRGAVVYMMDTVSSRPSLADRTAYASSKNPLAFVSVHCNSSTTSSGSGTECYYFTRFSSGLADYFASGVSSALGTTNRGGRIGRYYVTRVQDYPSILGEMGFVSNESDYYKLIQSNYQRAIASAIADSVQNYLGAAGRNGTYSYGMQSTDGSSGSTSASSSSVSSSVSSSAASSQSSSQGISLSSAESISNGTSATSSESSSGSRKPIEPVSVG